MAIANSRMDLARQQAANATVTTLSQTLNFPRTTAGGGFDRSKLEALVGQGGHGGKHPGGLKGLFASVMDNPLTKTILKPLEILDYGRRGLISGVHEISDALGSGDASWSDFVKQASDPTYGVGRYIHTGNLWADRFLGFVGDVAADPLTYATLGAGHFAGANGRLALAGLAAKDGQIADEVIAKVARYGRSALTVAEQERLGINRAGVYMFNRRIAGLDRIGQATEKTMAMVRVATGDTRMGNVLRRAFTPDDFAELRIALAKGDVLPAKAKSVVGIILSRDAERHGLAVGQNEGQRLVAQMLHDIGEADLKAYGKTIHTLLEDPTKLAAASVREQEIAARVKQTLDELWGMVDAKMKEVGPEAGFGQLDHYFPHVMTPEAWKFLADPAEAYSAPVRKLLENPLDTASHFRSRTLKEGDVFFGEKLAKEDLNVARLNEIANNAGFKGEFFHTDLADVAGAYAKKFERQMGTAYRMVDLKARGVFDDMEQVLKHKTVYDTAAIDANRKWAQQLVQDIHDLRVGIVNDVQDIVDEMSGSKLWWGAEQAAATSAADTSLKAAQKAGDDLLRLSDRLTVAHNTVESLKSRLAEGFDGVIPPAAQPFADQLTELQTKIAAQSETVRALAVEEIAAKAEVDAAKAAIKDASSQLSLEAKLARQHAAKERLAGLMEKRAAAAEEAKALATEVGDQMDRTIAGVASNEFLATRYEAIAAGGDLTSDLDQAIHNWLSGGLVDQKARTTALNDAFGVKGRVADYVKGTVGDQPWFQEATAWSGGKVTPTTISRRSEATVRSSIADLLDPTRGTSALEGAQQDALWLIARDERAFGGELPPLLAGARNELEQTAKDIGGALSKQNLKVKAGLADASTTAAGDAKAVEAAVQAGNQAAVERAAAAASPIADVGGVAVQDAAAIGGELPKTADELRRSVKLSSLTDKKREAAITAGKVSQAELDAADAMMAQYVTHIDGLSRIDAGAFRRQLGITPAEGGEAIRVGKEALIRTRDASMNALDVGEAVLNAGNSGTELLGVRDAMSGMAATYEDLKSLRQSIVDAGKVKANSEITDAERRQFEEILRGASEIADPNVHDVVQSATSQTEADVARQRATSSMEGVVGGTMQSDQSALDGFVVGGFEDNLREISAGTKSLEQTALDTAYHQALSAAIPGPVWTHKELYDALTSVEKAMLERQMLVGQGSNKVALTLDSFIQNGGKGARLAAKAERSNLAVTVGFGAKTVEEMVHPTAEQLSKYLVLSNISQNFTNMVALFAKHGAVPGENVLRDITRNVAADARTAWVSRVAHLEATGAAAEEIAAAKAMVETFQGMIDGAEGSATLYAALVDDAAKRMRDKYPAAFAAQRKAAPDLTAEATQLRQLKADPLYMKAQADGEIQSALNELHGVDLHRHTNPDGSAAFLVDGVPLMGKDGAELSFTRAEWESLFHDPTAPAVGVGQGAMEAQQQASQRLVAAKGELKRIASVRAQRGGLTPAMEAQRKTLTDEVSRLQAAIKQAADNYAAATLAAEVADPATRKAALEKMDVLLHGNGVQSGWFQSGADLSHIAHPDVAAVAERKAALQKVWGATDEKRLLDQVDAVAARADVKQLQSFATDAQQVADHTVKLADAADAAAAKAASEQPSKAATVTGQLVDNKVSAEAKLAEIHAKGVQARAEERKLLAQALALGKQSERDVAAAGAKLPKAEQELKLAQQNVRQAEAKFDSLKAFSDATGATATQLSADLDAKIAHVDDLLKGGTVAENRPPVPQAMLNRAERRSVLKSRSSDGARRELAKLAPQPGEAREAMDWLRGAQVAQSWHNANPSDPIGRMLMQASVAEHELFTKEVQLITSAQMDVILSRGIDVPYLEYQVRQGAAKFADSMGLKGIQADREIVQVLTNMKRLQDPRLAGSFNSFLGKYTRFFKAYATLSPGFHLRNAMSNTVSVFGAGASLANMHEGLGLYRSLMEHVRSGKAIEEWLKLPEHAAIEGKLRTAVAAMESAGGGRVDEAFADLFARKGSKVTDNYLLRKSRKWGERVEGSARFMLAWDSAQKGLDFNTATARVKRYLFDYMDVGAFDKKVKNIIPFWIWTSRNLPMQIVNQWTQPRTYAIYSNLMRNLGQNDSGDVVPSWLHEQGAVKIAPNWYLAPDFGFSRVQQQVADFTDPRRLLSMVNPMLRLPVELMGGKKLYNDVPFSTRPQQPVGGDLMGSLLALVGQGQQVGPNGVRDRNGRLLIGPGEYATSDRANYALMSLLPPLAQFERLNPSTDAFKAKELSSWLSYLGVPLKQVTPQMRESEKARQEGDAKKKTSKAKAYGYGP